MGLTEGSGLSPADIMAMTNNGSEGGFAGGSTWIWVFFLFFLLAWGGGGMFGNGANNASTQGALTRAELADGLGRQDIFRGQDMIAQELSSFERDAANQWGNIRYDNLQGINTLGTLIGNNRYDMMVGFNGVSNQLAENRFAQQECCCTTNRNIDGVKYENAKNTCDIVNTNNLNTREIIANQNDGVQRILDYLTNDKIEALRTDLQSANLTIQNMTQTNSLLNTLRPYPTPAYITCSPYTSNNCCGCNG